MRLLAMWVLRSLLPAPRGAGPNLTLAVSDGISFLADVVPSARRVLSLLVPANRDSWRRGSVAVALGV